MVNEAIRPISSHFFFCYEKFLLVGFGWGAAQDCPDSLIYNILTTILNLLSCIYSFQWFWQKKTCYVNLRHTYFNDYFTSQLTNSFFFGTTSVTVFGAYMWSKSLNFFFGETDHKFKRTIFKAASILKETIFQKIGVRAGHIHDLK